MNTVTAQPLKAKAHALAAKTSQTGFPDNQNVIAPNAGSGNISLYLQGATLSFFYEPNGDSQVLYGQNYGYPSTPLPVGVSTFPLAPGFNLQWSSTTGGFKLVWGVS